MCVWLNEHWIGIQPVIVVVNNNIVQLVDFSCRLEIVYVLSKGLFVYTIQKQMVDLLLIDLFYKA